jgi:hypothetical protein
MTPLRMNHYSSTFSHSHRLYSLCIDLSKDLQEEFLPFYPSILDAIIPLATRIDPHVLEV